MRINEDYIENIETDELPAEVVSTDTEFQDKELYRFAFFFVSKPTDITYVTEDGWKSISDELHRTLYGILDASPLIQDYRHIFPVYVGLTYYENLSRITPVKIIDNDFGDIQFFDMNNITRGRQALAFMLQFDANIRTLEKLRLLVLFLWKAFNVISRRTFMPEPQNITLCTVGGGYNDRPAINDNNYKIWLNKSSDEISRKRYRTFMKSIHPEITGKKINDMIYDFLKDTGDAKLAEVVNKFIKETKGVSHRLIEKGLQNVRLEGDTLVITKDKFNGCCKKEVRLLMKTTVKFRVEGLQKLQYGIGEYNTDDTLDGVRDIFDWLVTRFTGDWLAEIYIGRTKFYGQFSDYIVDLRTVTDHKVKFKKPGQYDHYIYESEIKFPIHGRTTLRFSVIDSFKTHEVELNVRRGSGYF